MERPFNQPINQSIDQTTIQSINQSMERPINQSSHWSINQSIDVTIEQNPNDKHSSQDWRENFSQNFKTDSDHFTKKRDFIRKKTEAFMGCKTSDWLVDWAFFHTLPSLSKESKNIPSPCHVEALPNASPSNIRSVVYQKAYYVSEKQEMKIPDDTKRKATLKRSPVD